MVLMTALMVLTLLLRRRPLAIAGLFLLQMMIYVAGSADVRMIPFFIVISALYTLIPARFGLLAAVAMHATFGVVLFYPHPDAIAWYTPIGLVAIAVVLAVAVWAFRLSLGGQSAFSAKLLDDQA